MSASFVESYQCVDYAKTMKVDVDSLVTRLTPVDVPKKTKQLTFVGILNSMSPIEKEFLRLLNEDQKISYDALQVKHLRAGAASNNTTYKEEFWNTLTGKLEGLSTATVEKLQLALLNYNAYKLYLPKPAPASGSDLAPAPAPASGSGLAAPDPASYSTNSVPFSGSELNNTVNAVKPRRLADPPPPLPQAPQEKLVPYNSDGFKAGRKRKSTKRKSAKQKQKKNKQKKQTKKRRGKTARK